MLSSVRYFGTTTKNRRIETSSSAFSYLQRKPRPITTPVLNQKMENLGLRSIASQNRYRAAAQKKMDNESTVMSID